MRRLTEEEFLALERDEFGQIVNLTESVEYAGHVYLDQTPLEIPVDMQIPESVESMVARLVRTEQLRSRMDSEVPNPAEEMDDFDVDAESPLSSYQVVDMVPELPEEDKAIEPKKKGGEKNGRKSKGVGKPGAGVVVADSEGGGGGKEAVDAAESDASAD